jgi:glycosyltransferase involved in cell wall biosynthesis
VFGAARVELVGDVDPDARTLLAQAVADGWVTWHGYLPNDAALQRLSTATYGLSLLHDLPNYRHSKPTKLHEYFAQGAVAISTPLPLAKGLIEHSGSGLVVPYGDAAAVVDAIRRLDEQPDVRRDMASTGYQYARRHLDWNVDARAFVAEVERVAASGRSQHGAPESGDSPS